MDLSAGLRNTQTQRNRNDTVGSTSGTSNKGMFPEFNVVCHSLPVLANNGKKLLGRFPVHRIFCIGRNYREHALEMGARSGQPCFFQKPASAVVDTHIFFNDDTRTTTVIPYPPMTRDLHHEGELIVALHKGGLRLTTQQAQDCIYGYSVGCDLTRRDLQAAAKLKSLPWDTAKGFDHSAPSGPIVPKDECPDLLSSSIKLNVNGILKQEGRIDHMIWDIPETISHLSQFFRLQPGDLVMTGTPAGVAALEIGDSVHIECGKLLPCNFVIGPPE